MEQSSDTTNRARSIASGIGLVATLAMGLATSCDADESATAAATDAAADVATDDATALDDTVAADADAPVGSVDRGTLSWSEPLALCTTWAPGQTLEVAARGKLRVTLPPRDYRDLTAATLATPLAAVLVERGTRSGEQSVVAPGAPTLDYHLADPDLTADAVFDFGALGTLTESYRVHRRAARLDPRSSVGEVTFVWRHAADVRLLVPCDGYEDTEPAAAVLALVGPEGEPPASLVAFYDTSPVTQVATHHHLKIVEALVADDTPYVAAAAGWSGLTYAANDPDHQDATLVDFERDLAHWQRVFRPALLPLAAPQLASVALHDVGQWPIGQSIATVDLTRRHPDETTSIATYAAPAAWRRVDAIHLARELGGLCPPLPDGTASVYIGALGPIERRLQVVACRRIGSPFQKLLVAVIPLAWRSAPERVGVAIARTDQVVTDASGATIAIGPDDVRIEPRADDTFMLSIRDGDGALVHESLGPQEPVADPRPRRRVVGGAAPGLTFALALIEVGRAEDGSVVYAPEHARLDAGDHHAWVADWTRLDYTNTAGSADDAADIATDDGAVIHWRRAPGPNGAQVETVDLVAADGPILIPTTTLEPR